MPPLPPSNLVNCGIIDLDYELFVEAQVSGLHKNLEGMSFPNKNFYIFLKKFYVSGTIPIVFGTIPLTDWKPPLPYTDKQPETDPSMLPTQPVSPASPPAQGGAIGWGASEENNLYPTIRKFAHFFFFYQKKFH